MLAHIGPLDTTFILPWNEIDRRWLCFNAEEGTSRYDKWKEKWDLLTYRHAETNQLWPTKY